MTEVNPSTFNLTPTAPVSVDTWLLYREAFKMLVLMYGADGSLPSGFARNYPGIVAQFFSTTSVTVLPQAIVTELGIQQEAVETAAPAAVVAPPAAAVPPPAPAAVPPPPPAGNDAAIDDLVANRIPKRKPKSKTSKA